MSEAVIVAGVRTPVGKATRGSLAQISPIDYGAEVIKKCAEMVPELALDDIDDLIIGCSFPEGEKGMNFARILGLKAGLPYTVPALTINRFCSSGLQTIATATERISLGYAEAILAGGIESMSMVPIGGNKIAPNLDLVENYPQIYMNMGLTAERVAEEYQVTREEQDQFAFESHQKAARAVAAEKFKDEILPINITSTQFKNGKVTSSSYSFNQDEGIRADTSITTLAKLKPAFKANGTVTAGNSSQTSDCAAMTLVMSKGKAAELGVKPWGTLRSFAVAGVKPEVMGIGPVEAVPKALRMAGLKLNDIDLIELNEAFAAQALAVIKELQLDPKIVNVNGGAIALGHPLGCTGTKLTISLLKEMERRKVRYGMVTMCIGGGMGAAGIFERYNS